MNVKGKVKAVFETQTFESGFQKREFVITTFEEYPQDVKFELYKEKCDLLNDLKEGDSLDVHFNIRGNEYNGRYYVNLNAWKIDKLEAEQAPDNKVNTEFVDNLQEDDSLPF